MTRFRFRLDTLRRLREIHRDELRVRLAEAYHAEQIVAGERAKLAAERDELGQLQRRIVEHGTLDVNRLLSTQRYQLLLEAQDRTLAEQAARLAEEAERRRQAVVEADREVQALDKLRARQQREHDQAAAAAEAKRLDEIGSHRWEGSRR